MSRPEAHRTTAQLQLAPRRAEGEKAVDMPKSTSSAAVVSVDHRATADGRFVATDVIHSCSFFCLSRRWLCQLLLRLSCCAEDHAPKLSICHPRPPALSSTLQP